MTLTDMANFIVSSGSATALGFICLYLLYKQMEEHKQETKEFTETIAQNNKLLELILQKVGIETEKEKEKE